MRANIKGAIISENVGFTSKFWLAVSSLQAKMFPKWLPGSANAGNWAG